MFGIKFNIEFSVFIQLVVIGALITGNFIVVRQFDQNLSEIEKTVDLVESNGTYSQQIPLFGRLIYDGQEKYRQDLLEAIDKFQIHLRILKEGGKSTEHDTEIAPIPASLVNGYFNPVENLWKEYQEQGLVVARNEILLPDSTLNPRVEEAYNFLMANQDKMLERNNKLVKAYLEYFDGQQNNRDWTFFGVFAINMVALVLTFIYIRYYVSRPISKLNEIDAIISEGNFDRKIDYKRSDELGKVANSINTLFQNLKNATDFIIDIGEGKLDTEYQRPTETDAQHDRLGAALLEMRDKMREVNEADRQRNWVSEGLAKFADIFRTQSDSDDFTYIIISDLVSYVEANQGGLFIVEDEKDEESHLELVAAYAYQKRKYLEKSIAKGEGLVGEVYQEGNTVYMTEVPDNYVHITSGLGEANPRSLLLVPLKLNDEIYGVVELASFSVFEPYKIEFVEKLGESIASTFASVKTSRQTQKLLRESIQLSEQMKAQEEEMRQNLEELVATQEEAQRKYHVIEEQKIDLEHNLEQEKFKNATLESQIKRTEIKTDAQEERIKELEVEIQLLRVKKAELEKSLEGQT